MPKRVLLNYYCVNITNTAWIVVLNVITYYMSDGVLTYIAMCWIRKPKTKDKHCTTHTHARTYAHCGARQAACCALQSVLMKQKKWAWQSGSVQCLAVDDSLVGQLQISETVQIWTHQFECAVLGCYILNYQLDALKLSGQGQCAMRATKKNASIGNSFWCQSHLNQHCLEIIFFIVLTAVLLCTAVFWWKNSTSEALLRRSHILSRSHHPQIFFFFFFCFCHI